MPLIRKDTTPTASDNPERDEPALNAASVDERWAAVRSLDKPEDVSALASALASETDSRVREAIFTNLSKIATAASVDAVLPYMRVDDAAIRTGALDALRAMPRAAFARLPALLDDKDSDVRLLACEIAREGPTDDGTRLLADLLTREREGNVCAAALDVLAEIGTMQALPAIEACAVRFPDDSFLAFSAKATMERIRSSSV